MEGGRAGVKTKGIKVNYIWHKADSNELDKFTQNLNFIYS